MRLPAPMLAKSGPLPAQGEWSFEIKWDGFRAIASTLNGLRVLSRRGRDMAGQLPELEPLPAGLVLDGELVAWGEDGLPSFPLLSARMLRKRSGIGVSYLIFDVLAYEGEPTMQLPYQERRERLEQLDLRGLNWDTPPAFDDSAQLWGIVVGTGLEGVVAKKHTDPYRPGLPGWIKQKNRDYWRFPHEVDAIAGRHR